jgi:protein-disulfide isomerase
MIATTNRQIVSSPKHLFRAAGGRAIIVFGLAVCLCGCRDGHRRGSAEITLKQAPRESQTGTESRSDSASALRTGRVGSVLDRVPHVGKLPVIDATTPGKGSKKPALVVVQFSDYECPYCGLSHQRLMNAFEKHKNLMRVYHRHFPLDMSCNRIVTQPYHKHSCQAALAAVCAQKQGKFWQMHHLLFTHQRSHHGKSLIDLAIQAGLDRDRFTRCLKSDSALKKVKQDIEVALALKVEGTPGYLMFGPNLAPTRLGGLIPEGAFDEIFARLKQLGGTGK